MTTSDVRQTLTFGREKLARQILLFCLIAVLVGILGVVFNDGDRRLWFVGWGLIVVGVAWAGYELSKTTQPQKPLLVLSPEGIRMRIEGATEFTIPWTEVHGVASITVTGPRNTSFDDVPAVLVSSAFYDRVIHVDSLLRRGPGWELTFIPTGSMVEVAFHPSILPVKSADLLAALEARYRAFGPNPERAREQTGRA